MENCTALHAFPRGKVHDQTIEKSFHGKTSHFYSLFPWKSGHIRACLQTHFSGNTVENPSVFRVYCSHAFGAHTFSVRKILKNSSFSYDSAEKKVWRGWGVRKGLFPPQKTSNSMELIFHSTTQRCPKGSSWRKWKMGVFLLCGESKRHCLWKKKKKKTRIRLSWDFLLENVSCYCVWDLGFQKYILRNETAK